MDHRSGRAVLAAYAVARILRSSGVDAHANERSRSLWLGPDMGLCLEFEEKPVTEYLAGSAAENAGGRELIQCINWSHPLSSSSQDQGDPPYDDIYSPLTSPNVMYIGDSLFAGKCLL